MASQQVALVDHRRPAGHAIGAAALTPLTEGVVFRPLDARKSRGSLDRARNVQHAAGMHTPMRETILVVSEAPEARAYLEQILTGAGYAVLGATGPEDAVSKAGAFDGPIDLFVSGLWLAEMTGIELHRVLAASRPGLRALYCSVERPAALIELVRSALSEAA